MPGGKVHTAFTIATALGVLAPYAVVNLHGNPYWYVAGNVAGVFLTPDHDVDAGNITDTIIRRVSPKLQWAWRRFWTPYALAIPHRGTISHFPILSTFLRLVYILIAVNIIKFIWWGIIRSLGWTDTVSFAFWWNWSFFWGLAHVDTVHWAADRYIKGKEQFTEV